MSSGLTRVSESVLFKRWSLINFDVFSCADSTSRILCFFAARLELFFLRFFLCLGLIDALIGVQTSGMSFSFSAFCVLLCAVFGAPGALLLGLDIAG